MRRQLQNQEVAQIAEWIEKRGFSYEDVRLEILDHVVCAMEDLMTEQPKLSLAEAYQQVHQSFGIFGFSTLEDAFIKSTEKRIFKAFLQELLGLLKPKSILFTLSVSLSIATIYTLAGNAFVVYIPLIVSLFFIAKRIGIYKREKSLRRMLSFRMALSPTAFTLFWSIYLNIWFSKIETSDYPWLWPGVVALFGLIEWAQWQVTLNELDRTKRLQSKLIA